MLSSFLGKRKAEDDVMDISSLISKVSKAIKGKNDSDILYQRKEKIMYLNIVYPNKVTINNINELQKIKSIKEVLLQKNDKKKAVNLILILENAEVVKRPRIDPPVFNENVKKKIGKNFKKSVYFTDSKISIDEILDKYNDASSISFDYYSGSIRMMIIEKIDK